MNKILSATLLTFTTVPGFLLFTQPAKADLVTYCYPVSQREVIQNPADHPNAYVDGYSEGRQSARKGDAYEPRSAGGEFARGFEDGYYGRPFTGQDYAVPDRVREYVTQQCNTYSRRRYYNNPYYYGWDRRYYNNPYYYEGDRRDWNYHPPRRISPRSLPPPAAIPPRLIPPAAIPPRPISPIPRVMGR